MLYKAYGFKTTCFEILKTESNYLHTIDVLITP